MSVTSSLGSGDELSSPCPSAFHSPSAHDPLVRYSLSDPMRCLVCGEKVVHRHFGERTCNSCAAFFRRTICHRKNYFCKQSAACNLSERRHKHRCAHCRFDRCLMVGMDLSQVNEKLGGFLGESDGSFLATIRLWHRGNFVARRRRHIDIFGLHCYENMWEKERNGETFLRATRVEAAVMKDFFRSTGLVAIEEMNTEFENRFCMELLATWLTLELVFNTRAHGGHRAKKIYYVDDSYMHHNEDSVTRFYRKHPGVTSPYSLAKNAMSSIKAVLEAAELIHRFAIDDAKERMAVMLICLLNRASRAAVPHHRAGEITNEVFRGLKKFYDSSFGDVAQRFGQLVLCIEAIEAAHSQIVQQFSIVRLDYKSPHLHGYDLYGGKADLPQSCPPAPVIKREPFEIKMEAEF